MSKPDLLIRNGKVYTEDGFRLLDVGVIGEKIAFLSNPGAITDATQTIDAKGQHVLPGIIDWHVHLREPGLTYKEDFECGTKAAAAGGVTMVCTQPNTDPVPNTVENLRIQVEAGLRSAVVDFQVIASPLAHADGHVDKLAAAGTAWFKIFQKVDKYPYSTPAATCNTAEILAAFKACAKAGRYCSVHPWDKFFHDEAILKVKAQGLPVITENVRPLWYGNEEMTSAGYQLYYLAKKAKMKWYAMHAWQPDFIDLVRLAKKEGAIDVIASFELMPSMEPVERLYDPKTGKWSEYTLSHDASPDEAYMWAAVMDGTIDFIGTDHAPHGRQDYEALLGEKPADYTPPSLGYPLLEWYGHLLLNWVNQGRLTLEKLVQVTSVNGAKAFDLYPRKGSNLPGTDADFTICDLNCEWTVNSERVYTKSGLSSYHGRKLKGKVTHTVVRGKVVMANGEVLGEPGWGKFIIPESAGAKSLAATGNL